MNTVQNEDNSHCIVIQPGENICDKVIGSPIIGGSNGGNAGAMGNIEEDDPELAAAIRMSLMENQQMAQPASPERPAPPAQPSQVPAAPPQPSR